MPEPLSEIQNSSSPRERVSVTHTCVAPPCRTALAVASEMICEISCTIQQGTSMSGGSRTRSIWQSHSFRRKATKCDSSGESVFLKSPSDERRSSTNRSEEHTSELQSLMRHSSAVFCLKKN